MPLKKLLFKPGVNRENTRYTTEGGFYDCDKIRFRQGTPEKIGGWERISSQTFLGVCRSLWNWVTLGGLNYVGVGTNRKFYIQLGGGYNDITPIAHESTTLGAAAGPFTATDGSSIITVVDAGYGPQVGEFVTFSGTTTLGGAITATVLDNEFEVLSIDTDTFSYTIDVGVAANSSDTNNGGATVTAEYQLPAGGEIQEAIVGWGAGGWGGGTWGFGASSTESIRLWSQANFGEDLLFSYRGGEIYYWEANLGVTSRGIPLASLVGSTDCPTVQNFVFVSDASRFIFAFGANDYGSSVQDPMLIRWSDQESLTDWTVSATNQAGSIRLSHGSEIIACAQSRQEILVFTDSAIYSLQYLGAGAGVWGSTLLGDNISIQSPKSVSVASGVTYWMGVDKFYKYDGRVQTLRCDLRQYIFSDINQNQSQQVFSGTNEGFNEVWWFYCSANSTVIDKYVVYNYAEDIWYYGTLGRTAWLDSGLLDYPLAATYSNNLVNHEFGVDDNETDTTLPISAYITSSEFDIDDGHNFGFVWRIVPDITFRGSEIQSPQATMTLIPLNSSGSGYNNPASVGGVDFGAITRTAVVPVEEFTQYLYVRVRGRQLAFKVECNQIGATFQLGAPRIDIRPDGRR
jgi:hypothetical protein